jgi:hypothetical protein
MPDLDEIKRSVESMSPAEIAPFVQNAIGTKSEVSVLDWVVGTMPVPSIGTGTLGFLKVTGAATLGVEAVEWSAVVKVMDLDETENPWGDGASFNSPVREIEVFGSDFFDLLDGGFRAVPCYGISEMGGPALLWMEDMSSSVPHPWSRQEFLTAARQVGYFNGSWPQEIAPVSAWLDRKFATNRPLLASRSDFFDQVELETNVRAVSALAEKSGVSGITEMSAEYREVADSLVGLPRVICHNDLHSRNAFFRYEKSGPVTYGFDWASIGLGPAGLDGGTLAGGGLIWQAAEAKLIAEIESQMFAEYLGGLREAGYGFDRDQVRLGFLSNLVPYSIAFVVAAIGMPDARVSRMYADRFGVQGDELFNQLVNRLQMFKPLFDEAVRLARQIVR